MSLPVASLSSNAENGRCPGEAETVSEMVFPILCHLRPPHEQPVHLPGGNVCSDHFVLFLVAHPSSLCACVLVKVTSALCHHMTFNCVPLACLELLCLLSPHPLFPPSLLSVRSLSQRFRFLLQLSDRLQVKELISTMTCVYFMECKVSLSSCVYDISCSTYMAFCHSCNI